MTARDQEIESPWLVAKKADEGTPVRMRLFCFHHAGSSASIFHSWQKWVPAGVEVLAVQLPGREYRLSEPLLTSMDQITSELGDALQPLLDIPFAIFGHSMGALIAFNLVRLLRKKRLGQPEVMIVSGRNSPKFKWRDAGIQMLPDEAFMAAVRNYNGIPDALLAMPALQDLWLPRLRADLTISALYEYEKQPALTCPALVLYGTNDDLVSDTGVKDWSTETTGSVRYVCYSGDHFFLHSHEQSVQAEINAALRDCLSREESSR